MMSELKIVIIGDTCVGKTCIVNCATMGYFDNESVPTLGASYTSKLISYNDSEIRLQIWDTAGQERYRGMTPMYYRGAQIALIVFALNESKTFNEIDTWLVSLRENAPHNVLLFLVGNKMDLETNREITSECGQKKAEEIGASYFEVSAKTGDGIEDMFIIMPKLYNEKFGKNLNTNSNEPLTVKLEQKSKKKQCC